MNRIALLLAGVAAAAAARAQAPTLPAYLKEVRASLAAPKLAPGGKTTLTVTVKIAPGWHVYANKPGDEYAVPTVVEVKPAAGVRALAPVYSAPTAGDNGTKIHEGEMTVQIPIVLAPGAKAGKIVLVGAVKSQGCNATSCLPPSTVAFQVPLTVGKK